MNAVNYNTINRVKVQLGDIFYNDQAITTYTINDISFFFILSKTYLTETGHQRWDHGTCQAYIVG